MENILMKEGKFLLFGRLRIVFLEGGMTKEDQKRNEIFFNEILAKDEIDRLFDAKVLTNFKKYTDKRRRKVKDFNGGKKGKSLTYQIFIEPKGDILKQEINGNKIS